MKTKRSLLPEFSGRRQYSHMCVCVCERESERGRESKSPRTTKYFLYSTAIAKAHLFTPFEGEKHFFIPGNDTEIHAYIFLHLLWEKAENHSTVRKKKNLGSHE